jgi:hypothetical protein
MNGDVIRMHARAIATIGSGPMRRILELSVQTFRTYAERHRYDLVVGSGDSNGRPAAWAKILLMRRLLDAYREVLWLDADTMVLDDTSDLADALEPSDYQGLVRHVHADGAAYPNTGVWLVRGARGRELLDHLWTLEQFVRHEWWENAAFMHAMGYDVDTGRIVRTTDWANGTRWLDRTWNGHTGLVGLAPVRIRHYAGVENATRLTNMRLDLEEIAAQRAERETGIPSVRPVRGPWVQKWVTREERERCSEAAP